MLFSKTKIVLIILAIVAALGCLGFMGFRAFVSKMYNSRSCDWANIDNIEMHAGIDIPEIEDCECEYDAVFDAKKVVFTLDKSLNSAKYVASNNLQLLQGEIPKSIKAFANREFSPTKQALYVRQGMRHNEERYELLYEPQTRKLYVYLEYLD